MICPHCNQEHPEGTKFCPMTGERIMLQQLSCPSEKCIYYERPVIPSHFRFCPDCGAPLVCPKCESSDIEDDGSGYLQYSCNSCEHVWGDDNDNYDEDDDIDGIYDIEDSEEMTFDYGNAWSSLDDIRNGDIIVDGVTLGVDNPKELIENGYVHNREGKSIIITVRSGIYVSVPIPDYEEIGSLIVASFAEPDYINPGFFTHAMESVAWLIVSYESFPFFNDIDMKNRPFEIRLEIMKMLGYERIHNISKKNRMGEASFVSLNLNQNHQHVFITLCDDYMYVWEGLMNRWDVID